MGGDGGGPPPPRDKSPGEISVEWGSRLIQGVAYLKMGGGQGGYPTPEEQRALRIVSRMVYRWIRPWKRNAKGQLTRPD